MKTMTLMMLMMMILQQNGLKPLVVADPKNKVVGLVFLVCAY